MLTHAKLNNKTRRSGTHARTHARTVCVGCGRYARQLTHTWTSPPSVTGVSETTHSNMLAVTCFCCADHENSLIHKMHAAGTCSSGKATSSCQSSTVITSHLGRIVLSTSNDPPWCCQPRGQCQSAQKVHCDQTNPTQGPAGIVMPSMQAAATLRIPTRPECKPPQHCKTQCCPGLHSGHIGYCNGAVACTLGTLEIAMWLWLAFRAHWGLQCRCGVHSGHL